MPDNLHIKAEAELNGMKIVYEEHFSIAIDFIPCKCMLVSDDEEALVGLENHWKRRLDGVLDVFRSEPFFLEVVGCRVNKANTLAAVMEMEGIKTDDIVVFGDGVADVTMLQLAVSELPSGNVRQDLRHAHHVHHPTMKTAHVAVEKAFWQRCVRARFRSMNSMPSRNLRLWATSAYSTPMPHDRVEANYVR